MSNLPLFMLRFLFLLMVAVQFSQAKENSSGQQPLIFFDQLLKPDEYILSHYYHILPYNFLTIDSYDIDQKKHLDNILVKLFYSTRVKMKKLRIICSDESSTPHPIMQIHLYDKQLACRKELYSHKQIIYFDKEERVLEIHIYPASQVEDLKLDITVYGLNQQSIFHITRHLLATRDDPEQNEAILKKLYTEGYTTILTLLKHENYQNLYLPEHSLFHLPEDTNFQTPLSKTVSLLHNGTYISLSGIKTIPRSTRKKTHLLFVDKEKVRFLKNINPQESIIIKKKDLAEP